MELILIAFGFAILVAILSYFLGRSGSGKSNIKKDVDDLVRKSRAARAAERARLEWERRMRDKNLPNP